LDACCVRVRFWPTPETCQALHDRVCEWLDGSGAIGVDLGQKRLNLIRRVARVPVGESHGLARFAIFQPDDYVQWLVARRARHAVEKHWMDLTEATVARAALVALDEPFIDRLSTPVEADGVQAAARTHVEDLEAIQALSLHGVVRRGRLSDDERFRCRARWVSHLPQGRGLHIARRTIAQRQRACRCTAPEQTAQQA
jgi:hypothetical protein